MKVDITSTLAEKGIDTVKEFLQKLVGPPIEEVGLLLSDSVRLWRLKNQVRILQKAEDYIKTKNLKTKYISLKVLTPLLEGASLEEEEDLQEKWAALLVNYVDSSKSLKTTVFPYILTQISSDEAKGFEYIINVKNQKVNHILSKIDYAEMLKKFNLGAAEISNLIRLGLIREILEITANEGYMESDGSWIQDIYPDTSNLEATELGFEFLNACTLEN